MRGVVSRRARVAMEGALQHPAVPRPVPSAALLACLRHHLLGGETHYPERPGMAELRRRVGGALRGRGYPERGPDGVLITAGEGESLFVTLLGLDTPREICLSGTGARRHGNLLQWMGVRAVEPVSRDGDSATGPVIHLIGDRLFRAAGAREDAGGRAQPDDAGTSMPDARAGLPASIVIGSLDGVADMRPFRLGFVAAPPDVLAGITKWKQASSICSPAPSQRAALWGLGVRP
ncbi:MAG: hypothetical protein OXE96_15395 [Gemmatimonadetes bacterium]|nr:hypothetical protein [Gemmatimonadota bacterium]